MSTLSRSRPSRSTAINNRASALARSVSFLAILSAASVSMPTSAFSQSGNIIDNSGTVQGGKGGPGSRGGVAIYASGQPLTIPVRSSAAMVGRLTQAVLMVMAAMLLSVQICRL